MGKSKGGRKGGNKVDDDSFQDEKLSWARRRTVSWKRMSFVANNIDDAKISAIFRKFDGQGKGFLNRAECIKAFQEMNGVEPPNDAIAECIPVRVTKGDFVVVLGKYRRQVPCLLHSTTQALCCVIVHPTFSWRAPSGTAT